MGISESTSRADNADANTAEEVGQADSEARSEDGVTGKGALHLLLSEIKVATGVILVEENNSDNDTVNSHGFAENNTNQVLGANARSLDSGT